jgi:hypothetical protein
MGQPVTKDVWQDAVPDPLLTTSNLRVHVTIFEEVMVSFMRLGF